MRLDLLLMFLGIQGWMMKIERNDFVGKQVQYLKLNDR